MFTLHITEETAGKRTDKFLAEQLPQFPRAVLHKLFATEDVHLNGLPTKPGVKLRVGDKLSADVSKLDVKIADIELPIIYEDDNVLVVDKPAGVISHARGRYFDEPSVASFVRQKTAQIGERAGIVHRLDRATSGIMICAKNQDTLSWLQRQFADRKVKKSYTAVITGTMPSHEGVIDMPIARNPSKPKMFYVSEAGKQALTRYQTVRANETHSLLQLSPETGRTHQLRVHLNELRHPIVGDELYGGETASRLMLHAASLEIILPNKELIVFTAPLPNEFAEYANV